MIISMTSSGRRVIGTCSICFGDVTVPYIWYGVVPPTPMCSSCGAVAAKQVIPMVPMMPAPIPVCRPYVRQKQVIGDIDLI